jgi:uncharacterized membrane protein
MEWKLFSKTRGATLALDVDQIGVVMWMVAVLVIGLSLALRLNTQSAVVRVVAEGVFVTYLIGLVLIALGILHVVRTHFRATKAGQRVRLRYARPALFPLWFHIYGVPGLGARPWARRWASLRFDHGQAWAWGVESLLVAGIIEMALMLAAQRPIWRQIGMLVVLAAIRTTLQAVREQVARHGHGSASK